MCTGVSAPEALVLICARNDLFCYNRIGWRRGCVSGMSGVCLWRDSPALQIRDGTRRITPLHLILEAEVCQVFSWTDVPRMRLQLKILFGIKALPILKKSGKTCGGGGGGEGRSMSPTPIGGLSLRHVTGYRKYSVKFIGLCS